MSAKDTDQIKKVLESAECPSCQAPVESSEDMKTYFCTQDKSHFELVVTHHGGEKLTATLNGKEVNEEELREIEW